MRDVTSQTWRMFAQRQRPGARDVEFAYFGPQGFARQGPGIELCAVELEETRSGRYWSWMDSRPGAEPTVVSGSLEELTRKYMGADPDSDTPGYAERLGTGRIVRLEVRVLDAAVR